ncbi:GNAT family protein [Proteinivorax tanatarense]|uniref:GNAT family protein n=1 Tax=Proteinivorax tanatarense TaxID=1260629 RepID=A0AAU7VNU4_9FIRM
MYKGEIIRLREYRQDDLHQALAYVNEPETKKNLNPGIPYPYTLEDEKNWLEMNSATKDIYSFAIETIEDDKYIGGCGVNSIDWKNSVATIGIFIGKEHRGKGYGTDAFRVLVDFAFNQVNINKLSIRVISFNKRAIACYKKCGFMVEGTLRQEVYRDGKYYDNIAMGLLKEEYHNNL